MTKPIKRISIEELRSCTGFENYSDEEAQKTILTLEALSILFFELHQKSLREKEKNIPSKA
ncbi:MAG: hypothetical protein ACXVPQ_08600 [Bacteroidia bacterium]